MQDEWPLLPSLVLTSFVLLPIPQSQHLASRCYNIVKPLSRWQLIMQSLETDEKTHTDFVPELGSTRKVLHLQ